MTATVSSSPNYLFCSLGMHVLRIAFNILAVSAVMSTEYAICGSEWWFPCDNTMRNGVESDQLCNCS